MPGIVERALDCLGRGFDVTSDFRIKFCKGKESLVSLNESDTRDLLVPGFGLFPGVSVDIKCDKGDRIRYQSDVLQFHQVLTTFLSVFPIPIGFSFFFFLTYADFYLTRFLTTKNYASLFFRPSVAYSVCLQHLI